MKRSAVIFLILALAASAFASGGGQSNSGSAAAPAAAGFTDYSKGFPQKVTIQIPVYDRAFQGWNVADNYWTRWMQKEFGDKYNVNVQYVAIGRATEVQDYQQLLASHRAPNIIFHYDMPIAVQYYGEGVMQKLNWDEMANYMPTFWNRTKPMVERYGTINNDRVFFFAERPEADPYTTLVRNDWVQKAGYKVEDLTSLETFNQMLLKWRDMGLGVYGTQLLANNFTYSYPFRDWPINDAERTLYSELSVADLTWAPSKAFLKDMNWKYNNNVLDKEFYLRNDEAKTKAEFVAGRTGNFSFYMASNTDVMSSLKANNPTADVAVLPPGWNVPQGKVNQGRGYWPFGMIMGINYESTDQQRIATWMFLEWLNQDANLFALQNGVAGQNYTLDTNGLPVRVANYNGESNLSANSNKDYWCLIVEAARYPNQDMFWAANKALWTPAGYGNLVDDLIKYYRAASPYRTPDALFTVPLTAMAEYRADLNVLFQELYVKCVTCPEAQFESVYADACKTYLSAGYQSVLDEKQKVIAAGNYIK
ncbi:MAG: hypothetical protein FWD78_05895 [Treponema sp.]|nr:hypothetical protein [Treponema sp.]